MHFRRAGAAMLGAVLATGLSGCGGSDASGGDGGSASGDQEIVVLAASSLTEAFGDLKRTFEANHRGVTVELQFDSSSVLAEQIIQGSPVDVLATADEKTMKTVTDADLAAGDPQLFATNSLVIVTPPDNPGRIASIDDLGKDGVSYAACVPEAPCGNASAKLLGLSGVKAAAKTEEQNVKGVLTKVTLGEVDAGLVYKSDAQSAGDKVKTIDADNASQATNADPIVVLRSGRNEAAANKWVALVTGAQGQKVLESYGFGPAAQ